MSALLTFVKSAGRICPDTEMAPQEQPLPEARTTKGHFMATEKSSGLGVAPGRWRCDHELPRWGGHSPTWLASPIPAFSGSSHRLSSDGRRLSHRIRRGLRAFPRPLRAFRSLYASFTPGALRGIGGGATMGPPVGRAHL